MSKNYYVYILASQKNGTLYTGVTNNLLVRVHQHKTKFTKGFTGKYGVTKLVYYEHFTDVGYAIEREKNIKKWKREWKLKLIEEFNPEWKDLYKEFTM